MLGIARGFAYAPGGGLLWGHTHSFSSGRLLPFGPMRFPGTEPAGDYPIHVIVKQGRTSSWASSTVRATRHEPVSWRAGCLGSFGVENELAVDSQP